MLLIIQTFSSSWKNEITKIACDKYRGIEVLNFAQLFEKLQNSKNHKTFPVHKLQFYLILIVTKKPISIL